MKRIKKMIAFVLMVTLIMSALSINTYAASFLDTDGHWAQWTIENLASRGIISGKGDGRFEPDAPITRAEFFTIINNSYGFTQEADISFRDVGIGEWYAKQIRRAVAAGYLTGYEDNTARPNANITRSEVSVVISKLSNLPASNGAADRFTDAATIPSWAKGFVDSIAAAGFMSGYPDGSFGPARNETRAEAAVLIAKANDYSAANKSHTVPQSKSGDLTLDKSYGPESGSLVIDGNVTITANGLTLKNVTIKGDLFIDAVTGSGTIYLTNITVEGTIYVRSGKTVRMSGYAEYVIYSVKGGSFGLTSGQIGTFNVTKEAEGCTISVYKDAVIDYAVIDAKCTLTGGGKISIALINVSGVIADSGLIRSYANGSLRAKNPSPVSSGSSDGWTGGIGSPSNPGTDPGTEVTQHDIVIIRDNTGLVPYGYVFILVYIDGVSSIGRSMGYSVKYDGATMDFNDDPNFLCYMTMVESVDGANDNFYKNKVRVTDNKINASSGVSNDHVSLGEIVIYVVINEVTDAISASWYNVYYKTPNGVIIPLTPTVTDGNWFYKASVPKISDTANDFADYKQGLTIDWAD